MSRIQAFLLMVVVMGGFVAMRSCELPVDTQPPDRTSVRIDADVMREFVRRLTERADDDSSAEHQDSATENPR